MKRLTFIFILLLLAGCISVQEPLDTNRSILCIYYPDQIVGRITITYLGANTEKRVVTMQKRKFFSVLYNLEPGEYQILELRVNYETSEISQYGTRQTSYRSTFFSADLDSDKGKFVVRPRTAKIIGISRTKSLDSFFNMYWLKNLTNEKLDIVKTQLNIEGIFDIWGELDIEALNLR